MSFYMPLRLREQQRDGYSGFEARYYSLFPSYDRDMAPAASLQQFLLALAYRLALQGEVTHEEIPDDPTSESERRQPFFFSAAGVPAFYVHRDSRNQFLRTLLRNCKKTRPSRRHPGYFRISIRDYRRALLAYIQQTAGDLAEAMNMQATLADLAARCNDKQQEASHRLLQRRAGRFRKGCHAYRGPRVQSPGGRFLSRRVAARTSARGAHPSARGCGRAGAARV